MHFSCWYYWSLGHPWLNTKKSKSKYVISKKLWPFKVGYLNNTQHEIYEEKHTEIPYNVFWGIFVISTFKGHLNIFFNELLFLVISIDQIIEECSWRLVKHIYIFSIHTSILANLSDNRVFLIMYIACVSLKISTVIIENAPILASTCYIRWYSTSCTLSR